MRCGLVSDLSLSFRSNVPSRFRCISYSPQIWLHQFATMFSSAMLNYNTWSCKISLCSLYSSCTYHAKTLSSSVDVIPLPWPSSVSVSLLSWFLSLFRNIIRFQWWNWCVLISCINLRRLKRNIHGKNGIPQITISSLTNYLNLYTPRSWIM